jgi:tetratricopeptide (TPR) repeat protein
VAFVHATEANPHNARHWQALAGEYMALKKPGALAALLEGVRRDSLSAEMWDMLGSVYAEEGDVAASLAAHRRALAIDGGNASLWYNLGNAQLRGGGAARAAESCVRAVALDARSGQIHFNLGIARGQLGDWPAAERAYAAALECGYAAARFNLALVYVQLGETEKAVQLAQSFLLDEELGERAELMRMLLRQEP